MPLIHSLDLQEFFEAAAANGPRPQGPLVSSVVKTDGSTHQHTDDVARFVLDSYEKAKTKRADYDRNWDEYDRLYQGAAWAIPEKGYEWKSFLVINYIYATIDTIIATSMDSHPKIDIKPRSPYQEPYVATLQAGLDSVWHRRNGLRKVTLAKTNACKYGVGYLKCWWDRTLENGLGDVHIDLVPSENMFVDPDATSFEDAEFVIERMILPVSYVRRHYGERAKDVKSDATDPTVRKGTTTRPSYDPETNFSFYSSVFQDPVVGNISFVNKPERTQRSREGYCTVYEMWTKDYSTETVTMTIRGLDLFTGLPYQNLQIVERPKYPHGRLIHVSNGKTIQDEPSPYREWPYVRFVYDEEPGDFYGVGVCERLKHLQRELDKRRSQLTDHAALMGNAVWILDKGALDDPEMLNNKPGMVITKERGYEVRREPPPPLPAWMMQAIELTIRDIREISGVSGVPGGAVPRGVRSGTGFQAAHDIATTRIRKKARNTEWSLADLGRIMVSHMQQFYTTPRMIRIMGSPDQVFWVPFDHNTIRGDWDLTIEVGSTMSETKAAIAQQAVELYKLQAIDKRALLEAVHFPAREQVLRRMGDFSGVMPQQYPGYPGPPHFDRGTSDFAPSLPFSPLPAPPMSAGGPVSGLPQAGGAPHAIGAPMGQPSQGGQLRMPQGFGPGHGIRRG